VEWHDFWRVGIILVCVGCLWFLAKRYRANSDTWNEKTRDYWFSLVMWSLAGGVLAIQGMVLNFPFGPGLVFVTAAALVSLKGLLKQGEWGGSDKARH
jgi:hypothetical protein